ncbi:MAG: hypothetical protein ABGW87_08810 [Sphingomonadaceae bacterium]
MASPNPHSKRLSTPLAPSPALARRGRLYFLIACTLMLAMAVVAIVQVLLILLRAGDVAGLLNGGFAFVLPGGAPGEAPPAFIAIDRFAVWQSTLAAALLTLRLLPGLVLLASLIGLFRQLALGAVFNARNATLLRRVAWALIAYSLVPFLTHAALYAADMSPLAIKPELRQLDALVLGILLFSLVHILAFGSAIEQDRDGFV